MTRPLILDTTIFVSAFRDPRRFAALRRTIRSPRSVLTAVTVAELYAGARSRRQSAAIDLVVRAFEGDGRLVAPTTGDWSATGRLIAHAIARRGAMEPRAHYPDVPIAYVGSRPGAVIVTDNVDDFLGWVTLGNLDVSVVRPKPLR